MSKAASESTGIESILTDSESCLTRIESHLSILEWMVGVNLAITVAILLVPLP